MSSMSGAHRLWIDCFNVSFCEVADTSQLLEANY